jgi:hypothetical protein
MWASPVRAAGAVTPAQSGHPVIRAYRGNAKTYMALLPLDVSASGVIPMPKAAIGPPTAAIAMYCRPLIEYVTAPPATCTGSLVCHKT